MFVDNIDDLAWSDFVEVRPGKWHPHEDSIEKIERLKVWAREKVEALDAEAEALKVAADTKRRELEEAWWPARLLVKTHQWINDKNTE